MPTTPTPFRGAPTSDATEVPCSPPIPAGSWAFSSRVGAARELRMRDVEAGVDDRHRHARARRSEAVDADLGAPPLLGLQWIRGCGGGRDGVRPLDLGGRDGAARPERGQDDGGDIGLEAPEPELGIDDFRARRGELGRARCRPCPR